MADREKILDRIRKLLALSKDSAAGIGEAANAAEIAARLIREHGFDDLDLEDGLEIETVSLWRGKRQEIDELVLAVAHATGCKAVFKYPRRIDGILIRDIQVEYYGGSPAPTIATFLHAVCYRAIDAAMADFRRSPEYLRRRKASTRRAASKTFKTMMIRVLGHKLYRLGWLTSTERARLADRYERQTGGKLATLDNTKSGKVTSRYGDAADLGAMAGNQVEINRPVSGADDLPLLGQPGTSS